MDADSKCNQEEFINGVVPQEPFSKLLIRNRLKIQDKIDENNKKSRPKSAVAEFRNGKNRGRDRKVKMNESNLTVFRQHPLNTQGFDNSY